MLAAPARTEAGRFTTPPPRSGSYDELFAIWSVATAEANLALDAWKAQPGARAYSVFVAAEDRASAAQDALATFRG
jgi:hypothetical protein